MPTTKQLYRDFKKAHWLNWCWLCGRDESERPPDWWAPFGIDRAHIVNKPRVKDVRAIVLLCSLCHGIWHGQKYMLGGQLSDPPAITLGNLLYLKRVRDPENFDRDFLQRYSVQRLPRAVRPPLAYRLDYHRRRVA